MANLREQQPQGPVAPPLAVLDPPAPPPPQSSGPAPGGPLTLERLRQLMSTDPEAALKAIQLAQALEAYELKVSEQRSQKESSLRICKEVQKGEAEKAAFQKNCEMTGHRRKDNSSAIGGQYDSGHKLIAICVLCQKTYWGVGSETGQLPVHLFNTIEQEYIGG